MASDDMGIRTAIMGLFVSDDEHDHKLQLDTNTFFGNGFISDFNLPGLNYKGTILPGRNREYDWSLELIDDILMGPNHMASDVMVNSMMDLYRSGDWIYYSIKWYFPVDTYGINYLNFNVNLMYEYVYKLGASSIEFIYSRTAGIDDDGYQLLLEENHHLITQTMKKLQTMKKFTMFKKNYIIYNKNYQRL